MAAEPLPTPRTLVTALLDTLALVPSGGETGVAATTPQRLPAAARPLLTTLHTLYPQLLLPALDLLDRRLVLRVVVVVAVAAAATNSSSCSCSSSRRHVSYYRVRSAQVPARPRGGRGGGSAAAADPIVYVVRTGAWSCSCAPFALSAFPVETAPAPTYAIRAADPHQDRDEDDGVDEEEETAAAAPADREFGGRSRDGRPPSAGGVGPGDVPCCKHLLACVLAERWGVLGPYVEEREVGPEEAVGLMMGS